MYDLTIDGNEYGLFTTSDMKVGDIGEANGGEVLLKVFEGIVSLTNPMRTWANKPDIPVRLYGAGKEVKLIVR